MIATSSAAIVFEVSAANLNLADYTDQTLHTFPDSELVHVPVLLSLYKEAGTAYTLTGVTRNTPINLPHAFHAPPFGSYSDMFGGQKMLYFLDNNGFLFFAVPAVGFLDQASAQYRTCFPYTSGGVYRAGSTKFALRAGCNLASGTGKLMGRLYYDDYAIYRG
jgi:hypothetical protein